MAEVKKTSSFFHPLISSSPLDPPKKKMYSYCYTSRSHAMSMSSFPPSIHIFLLSLISFFTIISILFLMVSTWNKHPSFVESLFGGSTFTTTILPSHPLVVLKNMRKEEAEFWKQDADRAAGGGFNQPCLCQDFSFHYRKISARVSKEKRMFLMFLVSGDLYQLRKQIVEAVIISRILGAALVIPVLKNESEFAVESEFADIFDMEHFIRTLRYDVRIVASHYTHLASNQLKEFQLPRQVTPQWTRTKFRKQLNDEGVLLLNGIQSTLVGKLPPDLFKLRCKVAFHALRFSSPVREIGYRLAKRLWIEGPYAAFDLGLNSIISQNSQFNAKHQHEHLKTGLFVGDTERQILETSKLFKGIGVPTRATLYAAGAGTKPLGAAERLKPLIAEYANLVSLETVARAGELSPFVNCSYAMAAIDYIVSLNSDVFLVSEDTYLDRAIQEHRAYTGKKNVINLGRPELRRTSNVDNRDARGTFSAPRCCMCKRALFRLF